MRSYDDIPIISKGIIDETWKQNKNIFESMNRKEMVDQIFDFMIEELMDKIEDCAVWRDS